MMVHASGQQHASKIATRQHRYKINFAQALSKMKNAVVQLIRGVDLRDYITHMLASLADTVEAVIPLRSFPRRVSNLHHNINQLCYKRCK